MYSYILVAPGNNHTPCKESHWKCKFLDSWIDANYIKSSPGRVWNYLEQHNTSHQPDSEKSAEIIIAGYGISFKKMYSYE